MTDQSWREQPQIVSDETAGLTAQCIGEQARSHEVDQITLILHGGEPLLAGQELIFRLLTVTRQATAPTNAVGLSHAYLRLFEQLGVRVEACLDGAAEAHRHRRFASGRGSYAAVSAGLHWLRVYRYVFGDLLCTIDLRNDPVATYEALVMVEPPRIDFLLPQGTWAQPSPGSVPDPGEHRTRTG